MSDAIHRVVEVYYQLRADGCDRCSPSAPHNVIFRCACGAVASGKTDHIWSVTDHGDGSASLSPSVNWLVDPQDPSKGSHLHEFATHVPVAASISAVFGMHDGGAEPAAVVCR